MHLLAASSGVLGAGGEAVDLDQDPADVLILSAADSELAALAAARAALGAEAPTVRLASLLALRHNMSVDLWLEKTARGAKLIIARVLGGRGYWPYGVDELRALCAAGGIHLALLPGGTVTDEALMGLSSLSMETCEALRRLFVAGGVENAQDILRFAADIVRRGEAARPPAPRPVPAAGIWGDEEMAAGAGPCAPIIFYRSVIEGGFTAPIAALAAALKARGLSPLPIFVTSLKDAASRKVLAEIFARHAPAVILNATAFASGAEDVADNPLAAPGCAVLQVILSGSSRQDWEENSQGLSPPDLAMNVVLPELDGRIISRAISFKRDDHLDAATQCRIVSYAPDEERVAFVAELAARWARLGGKKARARKVAIILANYPNRDGRIGNGVGYDTPASTANILRALKGAGYDVRGIPADGNSLIERLQAGPTNASGAGKASSDATLTLGEYANHFSRLPQSVQKAIQGRWGNPQDDPFVRDGAFHLPVAMMGRVLCAIQPARGYNIDPKATYHDPALAPPHGYVAFYIWLREIWGADAVIHNGKHGNLEWLPGKAAALSAACFPDAVLGPLPHLYPFIVNDPGEGAQAKRRAQAVIIDHLTPPMARAETHGPLAELERLVDEYAQASGLDARRLKGLREDILSLARISGVAEDAGIGQDEGDAAVIKLDAWLCDIKEAQIRNGLHVLGESPGGRELAELVVALARLPRGHGKGGDASLQRALAADLGLDFDPLDCGGTDGLAQVWKGARPAVLEEICDAPWRTVGDTLERLEALALALVEAILAGSAAHDVARKWLRNRFTSSLQVIESIETSIAPKVRACGRREISALLEGLAGRFIAPGPSGAPTRGRLDVLPTGRNFHSLDMRAVPTPAAWRLGQQSARNMLARHFQQEGEYPRAIGLSVWGTANMRTGGDDIAQALALIGARPVWARGSGRVTGFEIITLAELGRPRVDVTLRVSGFFRDAFPLQMELFDEAARAIGALDEPQEDNPIAARMAREARQLRAEGMDEESARRLAGFRVFGSQPGAYGAGLQALFDENLWRDAGDLAESYINWGAYAYGAGTSGARAEAAFRQRLGHLDAVAHNQDNREHDILDSDDYYQFEGGMTVAASHLRGKPVAVWHNDHSRPERPVTRSLEEEAGRVMHARVANPKWIRAMMRHGYKGAFEIAATVDYMFAFAATTGAVKSHHFEMAFDAFINDEKVRRWLAENNADALDDMIRRFDEALARRFWRPKSNSAAQMLAQLRSRT